MHLIDLSVGFMGATPIVGGTVPLAVGSAWSSKLKGERNVTLVYFGDGCFEEGVVHESMNFAALHNLPVVFVCENNNFSVYTRNDLRQPNRPIWKIAEAHGLNAIAGNGNCIEDVIRLSNKIIEEARYGRPGFIEFSTYRWREHCGPNFDNELGYRSEAEIDSGHDGCPIEYHLRKSQINPDSVLKFNTELEKEISEAFNLALLSRKPTTAESKTHIYA